MCLWLQQALSINCKGQSLNILRYPKEPRYWAFLKNHSRHLKKQLSLQTLRWKT